MPDNITDYVTVLVRGLVPIPVRELITVRMTRVAPDVDQLGTANAHGHPAVAFLVDGPREALKHLVGHDGITIRAIRHLVGIAAIRHQVRSTVEVARH